MISLAQLLEKAGLQPVAAPAASPLILDVADNSRQVTKGTLFVAIRGGQADGHRYLSQAEEFGAVAAVVEADYVEQLPETKLPLVRIHNSRRALGLLAHAFFDFPARSMTVCGVTGTNGKSTVTHLLEGVFKAAGYQPGIIGTIAVRYGENTWPATHTTPGAVAVARQLREMRDHGVDALAMEVSSHGIDQERIAGIDFNCGVLTNITQDHLDYHGDMAAYAAVKRRFLTDYVKGLSVISLDDPLSAEQLPALNTRAFTYGAAPTAQVRLLESSSTLAGTQLAFAYGGGSSQVHSPLKGDFNIANLLAAAAAGLAMGFPMEQIQAGLESVRAVAGRFETVDEGQDFYVVVDFAHTPDALERVLGHAKHLTKGRLAAVFGAGGDRDATKRKPMGQAAGRWCDWIIVTNDNQRTEDPRQIADAVLEGVMETVAPSAKVELILDRRQAIHTAVAEARPGDLIIIAGKGHEGYEMVGDQLLPFDDRDIAREALRKVATQGSTSGS